MLKTCKHCGTSIFVFAQPGSKDAVICKHCRAEMHLLENGDLELIAEPDPSRPLPPIIPIPLPPALSTPDAGPEELTDEETLVDVAAGRRPLAEISGAITEKITVKDVEAAIARAETTETPARGRDVAAEEAEADRDPDITAVTDMPAALADIADRPGPGDPPRAFDDSLDETVITEQPQAAEFVPAPTSPQDDTLISEGPTPEALTAMNYSTADEEAIPLDSAMPVGQFDWARAQPLAEGPAVETLASAEPHPLSRAVTGSIATHEESADQGTLPAWLQEEGASCTTVVGVRSATPAADAADNNRAEYVGDTATYDAHSLGRPDDASSLGVVGPGDTTAYDTHAYGLTADGPSGDAAARVEFHQEDDTHVEEPPLPADLTAQANDRGVAADLAPPTAAEATLVEETAPAANHERFETGASLPQSNIEALGGDAAADLLGHSPDHQDRDDLLAQDFDHEAPEDPEDEGALAIYDQPPVQIITSMDGASHIDLREADVAMVFDTAEPDASGETDQPIPIMGAPPMASAAELQESGSPAIILQENTPGIVKGLAGETERDIGFDPSEDADFNLADESFSLLPRSRWKRNTVLVATASATLALSAWLLLPVLRPAPDTDITAVTATEPTVGSLGAKGAGESYAARAVAAAVALGQEPPPAAEPIEEPGFDFDEPEDPELVKFSRRERRLSRFSKRSRKRRREMILEGTLKPPPTAEPAVKKVFFENFKTASTLMKQKKVTLAIAELKKSVGRNPRHAPSHRMLGIAYSMLKRERNAVRSFERYVRLSPYADDAPRLKSAISSYYQRHPRTPRLP